MAFPDVAQLVITYLTPILAPVPGGSRVPPQRPDQFFQVRRVGGLPAAPVRDRARLDVITWAPTDPAAMAIALDARTAIWSLAGTDLIGPVVYQVNEFMAPRQQDDDVTDSAATVANPGGHPRVWATYELTVRADDVIHAAPGAFS